MEPAHSYVLTPARGFTLVEMLVVLSIITIVTLIAVLGQTSFNRSLVLTDTAYTLAFSLREAQSFGLSSRIFGSTQNAGYGIHLASATPTTYVLFADVDPITPGNSQSGACPGHTVSSGPEAKPGNCLYTSPGSELVRTYSLNHGFTISRFCGTDLYATQRCSGSAGNSLTTIDILYLRPNTQSIILATSGAGVIPLSNAILYVASPDGSAERCVSVSKVGQVAVGNCP